MLWVANQACWEYLATQCYRACFLGISVLSCSGKSNLNFPHPSSQMWSLPDLKRYLARFCRPLSTKNVLSQSAGPYKRMFVSFLQPRIRAFFIVEAKFSYCILFWANTSALLSHIPSQIRWAVGCCWIFPMRSTLLSFIIWLAFSKCQASTISSSRTCFCNAINSHRGICHQGFFALLQCLVIAFFFFLVVIFNYKHCYIPFLHTILVWFGFFGAGSASSLCWQFSLNAIMALLYVSESFSKFKCFISHTYVPNKRVLVWLCNIPVCPCFHITTHSKFNNYLKIFFQRCLGKFSSRWTIQPKGPMVVVGTRLLVFFFTNYKIIDCISPKCTNNSHTKQPLCVKYFMIQFIISDQTGSIYLSSQLNKWAWDLKLLQKTP